ASARRNAARYSVRRRRRASCGLMPAWYGFVGASWLPDARSDGRLGAHVLLAVHRAHEHFPHIDAVEDGELEFRARRAGPQAAVELLEVGHGLAVQPQDDVAGGDAGLLGGALVAHLHHLDAAVFLERIHAEPRTVGFRLRS